MKVVAINEVVTGSTGNIMLNVAETVRNRGGEAYTFSKKQKGKVAPQGHTFFGGNVENLLHRIGSVTTGISGKGSVCGTAKLIKRIRKINPDIIHLHNLHGWYINIPMLFAFIRESKIPTVWTLHDCWGFTAQCSHFTIEKCDKWKTGCYACPRYRLYPYTFVDRTSVMWRRKKQWLSHIPNLTVVTPSAWLADLARQSFLGGNEIHVINNGINLDVFRPRDSAFRQTHHLEDKKIVLGVAPGWNYRKGLDVFVELAKRLGDAYQIVLVGTDPQIDKELPANILSIHRTNDPAELAEIYTAADVFVNPTREENFPTVNIEAIACGTPIVTFNTGGSGEIIDTQTGMVVDRDAIDDMEQAIADACQIPSDVCVARAARYDMCTKFAEYYALFETLV